MAGGLKIGVVGLGDIARVAYLDNLHNPAAGIEVVRLCDIVPERLEWALSVVPSAKATEDFEEVLAETDVNWVFILTPLLAHAPLIRKALEAGKNVYTEKPMSVDFEEAAGLVELSRKKGVYLASAPIMLLYPVYEYVRGLILGGAIGDVKSARVLVAHGGPDSFPTATDLGWLMTEEKATEIPPLPDLGIYGFSWLAHVFGPAKRVSAVAATAKAKRTFDKVTAPGFKPYTMDVKVKDNCIVNLEFAGGVLASVTANFVAGGHTPERFEMYGDRGTIMMPYKGFYVKIQSNVPPHNEPEGLHELDISGHDGGAACKGVNWGPIVASHLKKAAEMKAEPLIGRDFSLHLVEIIAAAMESARTGRTIELSTGFEHDKAWGV